MAKFSNTTIRNRPAFGPTATVAPAVNHEGGLGHAQDAKTALYTLAVVNMVGETTFYEAAGDRDARFRALVAQVTAQDPAWVAAFVAWLRAKANMRSAAVVAAVEYVRAGGPHGRAVIDSACLRADEPGEVLGYWLSRYGRSVPWPVKRGLADAARRLYNERNLLKYDTPNHGVRFGDVVWLAHPTASAAWQDALFRHALDRRHGRAQDEQAQATLAQLATVRNAYQLDALPTGERRAALRHLGAGALGDAGYTWERLSGWLPGGMDAEAWEAVIPSMGVMALIRNLRNIEQAGVSDETIDAICARISDPEVVAKSRQFPYRWWSAYRNSGTSNFTRALERALAASITNVPALRGRTAVFVDTSGSMDSSVSGRSAVTRAEVAVLFGAALAKVCGRSNVGLYSFARTWSPIEPASWGGRTVESVRTGRDGHNTMTWTSVQEALRAHGPFDRVVVFTDDQAQDAGYVQAPTDIPVYVWDLGGYGVSGIDTSTPGHYVFGGFTDAAFRLMGLLERGANAPWPWEIEAAGDVDA